MDGVQKVVLIGGPGTGKTNVATARRIQTNTNHDLKVRFRASSAAAAHNKKETS